jgi:hypothetical protein
MRFGVCHVYLSFVLLLCLNFEAEASVVYNSPAMDSKTLHVLEYPKILERLKAFCDFSASMELARAHETTDSYDLSRSRLAETSDARKQ